MLNPSYLPTTITFDVYKGALATLVVAVVATSSCMRVSWIITMNEKVPVDSKCKLIHLISSAGTTCDNRCHLCMPFAIEYR